MNRFTRFAAVGVLNTAIDYAVFAALVTFAGFHPAPANVIGYSAGLLNSFALNRSWTFAATDGHGGRQFARFLGVNLASLALGTAVVTVLAPVLGPLAAKLVATGFTLITNYALSARLVFRA